MGGYNGIVSDYSSFNPPDSVAPPASSPSFLTNTWKDVTNFFTGNGTNTTGMNDDQADTAQDSTAMQNVGLMMTVMGGINSAIGGYFAAKAQQYQDKSQALNLGYQADMANINARSAEYSAESTLNSAHSEIANVTMQAGQQKASTTATMAAHGVALGSGSAQEISASQDIVKDINVYTINANAARAAAQQRTQATNYTNQALMDRTGAVNANLSASSISPFSAVTSSLLTTASSVASNWNNNQRMKLMMGNPRLWRLELDRGQLQSARPHDRELSGVRAGVPGLAPGSRCRGVRARVCSALGERSALCGHHP